MHKSRITAQFFIILLVLCMVACTNKEEKKTAHTDVSLVKTSTNSFDQFAAQKAEKLVIDMNEITDAEAVVTDKELYIAAIPQHHERFQLPRLKKKMKQTLKNSYPHLQSYVSVDRKIFMLLEQLKKDIAAGKADKRAIKKRLKKIHIDMNSDT
ncbi:MAG: YhcN/YlaJ family sporulation lipoprotein [Ectobacillus sp.]